MDSNDDRDFDSAVWRCRTLKAHNATPFVMFNIDRSPDKRTNRLRRWANRPQVFWTADIEDYTRRYDAR